MRRWTAMVLMMFCLFLVDSSLWRVSSAEMPENAAEPLLPAFPGAEGGGMYASGGRGGEVVHVTNLEDSGPGSLREALSKPNRIVVFDVSGTIEAESDLIIQSNTTVAGQTAPGGSGITVKGAKIGLGGNNIIVRYISSRPGEKEIASDYDAWGGANGSGSIIDHCSIGWANDEQFGLYSGLTDFTTQWSVIGPANSFSYHSKGIHGFGVMLGEKNHSMHHNLLAHNISRNVRWKSPGTNPNEFVNNVIYNWGYKTSYGTLGHLNYVGNYLKNGPSTKASLNRFIEVSDNDNFKIYLKDNLVTDKNNVGYSVQNQNNWEGVSFRGEKERNTTELSEHVPIIVNGKDVSVAQSPDTPETAYHQVLEFAGAGITPELRPKIDLQTVEETRTGTGSLTGGRPLYEATEEQREELEKYGIQYVVYEYPKPSEEASPPDTDQDGMPDAWEFARGLDPQNPADANGDYLGQGYTNIEYYLNDLTVDSFPEGVVTLSPETVSVSGSIHITPGANIKIIMESGTISSTQCVTADSIGTAAWKLSCIEGKTYTVTFQSVGFQSQTVTFTPPYLPEDIEMVALSSDKFAQDAAEAVATADKTYQESLKEYSDDTGVLAAAELVKQTAEELRALLPALNQGDTNARADAIGRMEELEKLQVELLEQIQKYVPFRMIIADGNFYGQEDWVFDADEDLLIGDYHFLMSGLNGKRLLYGTDGYVNNKTSLFLFHNKEKVAGSAVRFLPEVYGGEKDSKPLHISFMFTKNGTSKMSAFFSLLNEAGDEVVVVGNPGSDVLSTFQNGKSIKSSQIALAGNNPLGRDGAAAVIPDNGKCWTRVELTLDFAKNSIFMEAYSSNNYQGSKTEWGRGLFAQQEAEGLINSEFAPLVSGENFNVAAVKIGTSNAGNPDLSIAFDNLLIYEGAPLDYSLKEEESKLPAEVQTLMDEFPPNLSLIREWEGENLINLIIDNPENIQAPYLLGIYDSNRVLVDYRLGVINGEEKQTEEIRLTIPRDYVSRIFVWNSMDSMLPVKFR